MSRVIAFFDFDGTISNKDSLLEFIKYSKGRPAFYAGFLLHLPVLAAFKLKLISNHRAKEIMLRHFFGSMPVEEFERRCLDFSREAIPGMIRPKAWKEIGKLQEAGAEIVIVSASPQNWLGHWCKEAGVACIATRLAVDKRRISGIEGLNCHGREKVRRIREAYDLSLFSQIYCYGDTSGDRHMLSLGTCRFYKPFR